jgi:small subunit ribosomal protein S2
MTEKTGMPIKQEMFLEAGVHIGTKIKTNDMRKFIFRMRDDGLYILDLRQSAQRLISAAKLMAKYNPEELLIIASRIYSSNPASKFSSITGVPVVMGRFIPGTMTNMSYKGFKEPKLIFVCDPKGEREAISEAAKNGVPVIALCDTDNETKFVDFVIPINNKGRRSLALIFFILARELAMAQGQIKSYEEFVHNVKDFEQAQPKEEEKEAKAEAEKVETEVSEEKEEGKEKKAEAPKEEETKTEKSPEKKGAPKEQSKEEKTAKEEPKKETKAKEKSS